MGNSSPEQEIHNMSIKSLRRKLQLFRAAFAFAGMGLACLFPEAPVLLLGNACVAAAFDFAFGFGLDFGGAAAASSTPSSCVARLSS
mmetsp:Transcript_36119/g.59458  ORF Transcript_36119/g.59458 Transcript_36119/m.59458 type:complete len:87 (+) Transcript_36119:13-273(+)